MGQAGSLFNRVQQVLSKYQKFSTTRWLRGAALSTAAFIFCILLAYFFCLIAGDLCRGSGGRNIHPLGIITGILLCLTSIGLALKSRPTRFEMLAALLPVECLVVFLTGYFIGSYDLFSRLFTGWIIGLNLYIALPWLVGILIGSIFKL